MDGASKFVRGDAVAGLLILIINLVGGLLIGLLQYDMTLSDAARAYILLTIGDGLVAQLPALILSLATAIIVTRVTTSESTQIKPVNSSRTRSQFYIAGGILTIMGLVPGMPNMIFLLLGATALGLGFYLQRSFSATDNAMPGAGESNHWPIRRKKTPISNWAGMMPVRWM